MKKISKGTILTLFIGLMMTGCRNSYEDNAVGHYKSYTHLLENREGPFPDNSKAEIDLNPDMTFSFKKDKVTINGIWNAYDDGDHTWLTLKLHNGGVSNNFLGTNSIELLNASLFNYSGYFSITFNKTSDFKTTISDDRK
jgi:hypothetical protein